MAFTYNLASTGATLLISQVRLLIPDHDAAAYDLEDAEIQYFLNESGNQVQAAAAAGCEHLARKYAKRASFTADGLSVQNGERARLFGERAGELRQGIGGKMSAVVVSREDGFSAAAAEGEYDTVLYTWRK